MIGGKKTLQERYRFFVDKTKLTQKSIILKSDAVLKIDSSDFIIYENWKANIRTVQNIFKNLGSIARRINYGLVSLDNKAAFDIVQYTKFNRLSLVISSMLVIDKIIEMGVVVAQNLFDSELHTHLACPILLYNQEYIAVVIIRLNTEKNRPYYFELIKRKSLHPLEPSASPMGFNILEMSEEGYVRTGKISFSNIKNIISYLMHVETEHLNFLDSMMYGYELQTKKMFGYFNFAYSVISPLSTAIP